MNSTTRRTSGPGLGLTAKIVLATAAAMAVITGVGVSAATAASTTTSADAYSFEAFRETIKPWDSISIPALSCPTGYFQDVELSPGRIVPKGVEILEPSAIGVTIAGVKSVPVTDWWNKQHHPVTATDPDSGFSTATNWDPFSSHELIIRLYCTTDLSKAYKDPSPYS
jgi:hypothetical protein